MELDQGVVVLIRWLSVEFDFPISDHLAIVERLQLADFKYTHTITITITITTAFLPLFAES
jgi:hypothetical protein